MSKITVELFVTAKNEVNRAIVIQTPGWLGRLFGRTRTQSLIEARPREDYLLSKAFTWHYVNTGREVTHDIYRALERQEVASIPSMRVIK